MILHVAFQPAGQSSGFEVEAGDTAPPCATVVLQHPGGELGFERGRGAEALRSLVGDVVVVDRSNSPAWVTIPAEHLDNASLHGRTRRPVTCSRPGAELQRELDAAASNTVRAKVNALAERVGREPTPLVPTLFDDWITPDGRVRVSSAARIVAMCDAVCVWTFSDWGLHPRLVGRSRDDLIARVTQAAASLGARTKVAPLEASLPTW